MAQKKNKLQRLRESRGLSRKNIALLINRSTSHICNIERGVARLTDEHKKTLINKFDLDSNYFDNMSSTLEGAIPEKSKIIGKNIKFYRKRMGITQQQFAEEIGYNQNSSVSVIERGLRAPSKDMMFKIAEFFDIHISELFADKEAINYNDSDVLINKFIYIINSEYQSDTIKKIAKLINDEHKRIRQKERLGGQDKL